MYIVGEDEVTKAIIRKVLKVYAPALEIQGELPARGSEIKHKIKNFNALASTTPVVLLTDLDTDNCAPLTKNKLLEDIEQQENFIINVAVDEAEAWLMADRVNFANYLGIDLEKMPASSPQKQGGFKACQEMNIPMKASYYLTHCLIMESSKTDLKEQVQAHGKRCKGREYNTAILPFIDSQWNLEQAMENSDSLRRMVDRLRRLNKKYSRKEETSTHEVGPR